MHRVWTVMATKTWLTGILLYIIGQTLTWFQVNGQFISPWMRKHPLIISVIGGTVISYVFIYATRLIASYYDGLIWPGRFIGFSMGVIVFSILTYSLMNEGINFKTLISLTLAFLIILVQIFLK